MRETISFEVEEKGWKFLVYTEPTIKESQEIERSLADFFGGHRKVAEIRARMQEYFDMRDEPESDPHLVLALMKITLSYNRWYILALLKELIVEVKTKDKSEFNIENILSDEFDMVVEAYEVASKPFRK